MEDWLLPPMEDCELPVPSEDWDWALEPPEPEPAPAPVPLPAGGREAAVLEAGGRDAAALLAPVVAAAVVDGLCRNWKL